MIVCSSEYEQFFDEMISLHLIKFSNYQAWGVKIFLLYLITATHCFHQHALNGFSFQTCPAIFCSLCWMMSGEAWSAERSCLIGVSDGLKKDKEWTVGVKAPTCQGKQLLRCFFVGMKLEKLAHSVIACPDKLIMTKLVKTLEMN